MNFKLIIYTLFLVIISNNIFANELNTPYKDTNTKIIDKAGAILLLDEGRTLFNEGKVKDALTIFREAAAKDPYNWKPPYWISNCHLLMNNFGFSLKYAKEALSKDSKEVDKEVYEIIGRSFHQLGKTDSAIVYYNLALQHMNSSRLKDLKVQENIKACELTNQELAAGKKSIRTRLKGEVNTGFNEYAPVLTNNGKTIYFTSRRNNTTGGKANPYDQEYYEDIYRAELNPTTDEWINVTNEIDRLNSEAFDALTYIAPNGLYGTMTINTAETNVKPITQGSDLFEINFTDKGKWSTPKLIKNKTINTSFFEGSATVTSDGSTMYFVSDRKGDKKSTDIYVVQKVGKKWGEAVALSDSINTIGRETTPYISPDGRFLFFSSDGHQGMGGLDVFVTENLGNGKWSKPINLGIAINSVTDDTHFQYYPELKKAILTSVEVQGQKASRDIYIVDLSNYTLPILK